MLQVLRLLDSLEQLSAATLCLPLPLPLPGVTSLKVQDVQCLDRLPRSSLAACLPALQQLSVSNLTQPINLLRALRGHRALRVLELILASTDPHTHLVSEQAARQAASGAGGLLGLEGLVKSTVHSLLASPSKRAAQVAASWPHDVLSSMLALEVLRVDVTAEVVAAVGDAALPLPPTEEAAVIGDRAAAMAVLPLVVAEAAGCGKLRELAVGPSSPPSGQMQPNQPYTFH